MNVCNTVIVKAARSASFYVEFRVGTVNFDLKQKTSHYNGVYARELKLTMQHYRAVGRNESNMKKGNGVSSRTVSAEKYILVTK